MIESFKLKNNHTGDVLRFGVDDEEYLIDDDGVDWGTVEISHNTFQYPTQVGVYKTSTTVGTRDVSITGWIIGETLQHIEEKKSILSNVVNPLQDVEIIAGEYLLKGTPSTNVKFGSARKDNNEVMCKFLVQIFCEFPMWQALNSINVSIADTKGMFGFPLIFKDGGIMMGLRKKSLFTDVANNGVLDVGAIIKLEAHGVVNNPEVLNVNTLERIKINKVMSDGEEIIINTSKGERSVVGKTNRGDYTNYIAYFDYDNEWMQLPVGITTLTYKTFDSSGSEDETYKRLDVSVSYSPVLYNIGGE